MGHTFRKRSTRYDEDEQVSSRSGKHAHHSNNRRTGGMKILNQHIVEDFSEYLEDEYKYEYEQQPS